MRVKSLSDRLKNGEDSQTEFKRSVKSIDALAQNLCAFLNTEGGTVICGVDANGVPIGIPDAPKQAERLQVALAGAISPPALFSVTVERFDEVDLLVLEAPPGPDKPYVSRGAVWLRRGAQTQAADAQSLRAFFQNRITESERWERRPSVSMLPEDLDEREVLRLRDEARRRSRFDFSGEETAEFTLSRLGMTRPGGFTQAADVLFAHNPALRHPQARVQLVAFDRDEASDDYSDYRWFEGPLLRVAEEVVDVLSRYNSIRATFRPDDIERRDEPRYAKYALREGVVNALAHRDYNSIAGGVKIAVHPSRIEIWNTGRLPDGIKPEDLPRKHPSVPTNPDIAHAFFLRSFMDRIGRGGQQLAEACKEIGARPPEWTQVHGGVLLTLHAALGKEQARRELLNARQRAYLDAVAVGEMITLADYRERFARNLTDRQARRDLGELETYRFVQREGIGRSTVYRRSEN